LVREYLGDVSGLNISEVACGRGGFVRQLARNGANVTGCDFSLLALRIAWSELSTPNGPPIARIVRGDAQNPPQKVAKYVWCLGWLYLASKLGNTAAVPSEYTQEKKTRSEQNDTLRLQRGYQDSA